ncbi:hypothetical protein BX070DRAFT_255061 [Coemansia spiralis]|nr:hypothetical protein BX070DRAFT_255061 [Coemansia spiralis]
MAPFSSPISQSLPPSIYVMHIPQMQQRNKALVPSAHSAPTFALMSLLVRLAQQTHKLTVLQMLFLRCIFQTIGCAGFGLLSHFFYMPSGALSMGIANVLFFTSPLFTAMIVHWFLSEHELAWPLYALLGAVLVVLAYVSVRGAGGSAHTMIHVARFGTADSIGSPILYFLSSES